MCSNSMLLFRLDIRRIGAIKERDEVVGNADRSGQRTVGARRSSRSSSTSCNGERRVEETRIDRSRRQGLANVEKSGSWFSYDSQRIGQGRENAKSFLKANPDIAAKIEVAIRQNSGVIAEKISWPVSRARPPRTTTRRKPKRSFASALAKPAFVLHSIVPPSMRGRAGTGVA